MEGRIFFRDPITETVNQKLPDHADQPGMDGEARGGL